MGYHIQTKGSSCLHLTAHCCRMASASISFIKNEMNTERTHPPRRPNAQLHPSTSPSPAASALATRGCRWAASPRAFHSLSCSKTLLLDCSGTHSTNNHPILQPVPDVLHTSCFCQALCMAASCPLCTFPHGPDPTSSWRTLNFKPDVYL